MFRLAALLLLLTAATTSATDYYVATDGDDNAAGTSWEEAFATISHGVEQLHPGDTLTIGPGTWHESVVIPRSGTADAPIHIRAQYPGRTELVGSKRLAGWRTDPAHGALRVTSIDKRVLRLVEKGVAQAYKEMANLRQTELEPGSWYQDLENGFIYVHPSDGRPTSSLVFDAALFKNGITTWVAALPAAGSYSSRSTGIIIEGLVVRDYGNNGIYIRNGDHCQVLNCKVAWVPWGIHFMSAYKSRVAHCEVAFTDSRYNREAGGITMQGYVMQSVIEDNVAYHIKHYGMRFYGAYYGSIMQRNLTYDCDIGIQLKGREMPYDHAMRYARFSDDGSPTLEPDLPTLFQDNVTVRVKGSAGSIPLWAIYRRNTVSRPIVTKVAGREHNLEYRPETADTQGFADPAWLDFRLQADSPNRQPDLPTGAVGALPYDDSIRFVGPAGDDQASGDSIAQAWRSLRHALPHLQDGQTLYLLPGTYEDGVHLEGRRNIALLAHGNRGDVVLPSLTITQSESIRLGGLRIMHELTITDTPGSILEQCEIQGAVTLASSPGAHLEHNLFASRLTLTASPALWLVNNLFLAADPLQIDTQAPSSWIAYNNAPTPLPGPHNLSLSPELLDPANGDYRLSRQSPLLGRGRLGRAIGPERVQQADSRELSIENVRFIGVGSRQVDLAWSFSGGLGTLYLQLGTDPDDLDRTIIQDTAHWYRRHHQYTLTDLEPMTRYYFRLGNRKLLEGTAPYHDYRYAWPERGPAPEAAYYATLAKEDTLMTPLLSFTTPAADAVQPRTIHVAKDGDDNAAGTVDAPLATIQSAANQAQPGDTVIVHEGSYPEQIIPMRSGLPGHPITYMAAPGERVQIDGSKGRIPHGFDIRDRRHLVVRGFIFFGQTEDGAFVGEYGQVRILNSEHIRLEQCVLDGRLNYVNAICVYRSANVFLHNNIFLSHHSPIHVYDNHANVQITHNTFAGPTLAKIYAPRNASLTIRNNLFGELLFPKKKHQYKLRLVPVGELDLDYNVYYMDPKNDERRILDHLPYGVDLLERTGLPEADSIPQRIGIKGSLDAYEEHGLSFDQHSLLTDETPWADPEAIEALRRRPRPWPNRYQEYPPIERKMFRLAEGSPLTTAAEDGGPIGASTSY